MRRSLRTGLPVGLVALGGIAAFAAAAAGYAIQILVDRDGFAEKVTEAVGWVVSPASMRDALASLAGVGVVVAVAREIHGVAS
jgi:hypothetical protein